jgi:hypothetical protein
MEKIMKTIIKKLEGLSLIDTVS